jgi:prolyl oligopeptidase
VPSGRSAGLSEVTRWLHQLGLRAGQAVDEAGAVRFPDAYRALEDETWNVQTWQARMNRRTDEVLAGIADLPTLAAELAIYLAAATVPLPIPAVSYWLWPVVSRDGRIEGLDRSTSLGGSAERLLRARDLAGDGAVVDWATPNHDGSLIAIGLSRLGDEQTQLQLVDGATAAPLGPPIAHVYHAEWCPATSRLFLAMGRARDTEQPLKRPAVMAPGQPAEWIDAPDDACDPRMQVQVSSDGRYLGLLASASQPRLLYAQRLRTGEWIPQRVFGTEELFSGIFVDDDYVAVTTAGADRGRVVRVPVAGLERAAEAKTVIAETDSVLRSLAALPDGRLLLSVIEDGRPGVRLYEDGALVRSLPGEAAVVAGEDRFHGRVAGAMPASFAGDVVITTACSSSSSPAVVAFTVDDARRGVVVRRAMLELPPLRHTTHDAEGADGHRTRYEIIRRPDVDPGGPALLAAYGGFNVAACPQEFIGIFAPWVASGGTYVFAHVRGDGTFGVDQWRSGRRQLKPNSFTDLLAVAEDLTRTGQTSSDTLAVCGGSNGGLLVAGAITSRPDLFRAAALLVPMTDMARLGRERVPVGFRAEYGDASIEAEAAWIAQYSPYHHVTSGRRYPPTLIVSGERDVRTHPWHARKLAAALAEHGLEPEGVLLRVHADRGHTDAAEAGPERIAEWLGFLMREVGLPITRRPPGWDVTSPNDRAPAL